MAVPVCNWHLGFIPMVRFTPRAEGRVSICPMMRVVRMKKIHYFRSSRGSSMFVLVGRRADRKQQLAFRSLRLIRWNPAVSHPDFESFAPTVFGHSC